MTERSGETQIHDILSKRRRYTWIAMVATAAVAAAGLLWLITTLRPLPPRTVLMTTGSEGGAYHAIGKRYGEILARSGIELRLLPSKGGIENLRRLSDPRSGVSVGFMQGGSTGGEDLKDLISLGTVDYEPLWFFSRVPNPGLNFERLRGKRVSIGPEGSGTRDLALTLLVRNGIDKDKAHLLPLPIRDTGENLLAGKIDAALLVASWESPVVRELLSSPAVGLVSFPRADAYAALYPFLSKVVVPAGVGDLMKNLPPADVVMLAPKTSLVVRNDLHPAIQYLLLDAATEIHSDPGIFRKAGQFPAPESVDLPLSAPARQFHKTGRPFLQRYLPFWAAVLAVQLMIVLIPVIGAFYPVLRLAPAVYGWGMRRGIFRLYSELKLLEVEIDRRDAVEGSEDLAVHLDRIEDRANNLKVPASIAHMLYALRRDILLVRRRLAVRQGVPPPLD